MNTLGLIYKKIKSINLEEEKFEENLSEIYGLIDKQFQNGYFWAAFYSYYELFSHLIKIKCFQVGRYFSILNGVQNIVNAKFLSKEEVMEIFINNPFLKEEFLDKVEGVLGKENFRKIKNKIELIFSQLPDFGKDDIESLYSSVSLHDFLKFLKFLKDKGIHFDEEKVIQMIVNNIFSHDVKVMSEKIGDIINFGLANKNFGNVVELLRKILLRITVYLYANSNIFGGWKKIFLISTYENMGRYLRIVKDYSFSSFVYLLAAVENWFIHNYGYCSKCIFQISRVTEDKLKKEFFINLAINIALFEVSFIEEVNYWKKEISQKLSLEEIQENILTLLEEIIHNFRESVKEIFDFEGLIPKIKDCCTGIMEKIKQQKFVNLSHKFYLN